MDLLSLIDRAGTDGKLLPESVENLHHWLEADFLPQWAQNSLRELVESGAWEELDNRFYRTLAFGTGGMRDRTIGSIITKAEQGEAKSPTGTPAHAAVGCALLNDFNVIRATLGLHRYCARYLREQTGRDEPPRLVIAHDVRHFSRHFCLLVASTWTRLGGTAFIFEGPRSTPHLSFAVRHLDATAGIVITASHNPPHDNGYKVYFSDGGQVVYPHAEGIIHEVQQVKLAELTRHLDISEKGIISLGESIDQAYLETLREVVLDPETLRAHAPSTVFTPIHGVGSVSALPALRHFGVPVTTVPEQEQQDPRFPTVKSPNPENAEALTMALRAAEKSDAELLIATDPDADRMGVAVRDPEGHLELLNGNTIGALLLDYRIRVLQKMGWLPREGTNRAALIKTFVTTPLQERIARGHGLKVIQTLTGFKYIGEKLQEYEQTLRKVLRETDGIALDYDHCDARTRAKLLLQHSTFYVFGGEESYGYLASDTVRDKDANAAALLFCELAAALKRDGITFPEQLDRIYLEHGYHQEGLVNLYYEGATGSRKIRAILESYRKSTPTEIDGHAVVRFDDFGVDTFEDADGKEIPKQDFYFLELDNGYSYAVRGSGTEPKIKFYLFGNEDVSEPAELAATKERVDKALQSLAKNIEADARERAES